MEHLLVARHAEAESNAGETVSGVAPGGALTEAGVGQARALGRSLAAEPIDLVAVTEFRRTQETAELALAGREVPRLVVPELNEIDFGRFEGGLLADYRAWAWAAPADELCPGGAESRGHAAARYARGLELLLARPERTVLAVSHAVPIRYLLDAADGRLPAARVETVAHAEAIRLDAAAVRRAAARLRAWSASPSFGGAE
jgi:broad specificity phosphatase PhoE